MSLLHLALVQPDLVWAETDRNLQHLEELIKGITQPVDLVILPEMFTSAFDAEAKAVAEEWPGTTVGWMQKQAKALNAAITGSIATTDNGKRFNRLVFVTPDARVQYYDKRHLFRMLGEDKRNSEGSSFLVTEWRGWRIFPLVCYDLRFPVWCRNSAALNYDLMLFVANWPSPRTLHWSALLKARAIENLAYVAGVNRTGTDVRGLSYDGASAVESPQGESILMAGAKSGVYLCTLDKEQLDRYRKNFPAYLDADSFMLS
jgi:predicted amidohydrolase